MEEVLAPGWAGRLRGRRRGSVAPARDLFAARLGLGVALVGLWVARYVGAAGFATGMLTRRRAYARAHGAGGSCCDGLFLLRGARRRAHLEVAGGLVDVRELVGVARGGGTRAREPPVAVRAHGARSALGRRAVAANLALIATCGYVFFLLRESP